MCREPLLSVAQAIHEALVRWGIADDVSEQHLASLVQDGVSASSVPCPEGGAPVWLFRFFSPVSQREEVFLGNVLLNDFLSKTLVRTIEACGLGRIALIANDLESSYYLYQGNATVPDIAAAFQQYVLESLSDLYFGKEDPERGLHGTFERMFTFTRKEVEPFPVYTIPTFLARDLERAVRAYLLKVLSGNAFAAHRETVAIALAFFYGQTSGGRKDKETGEGVGDAQSPATFLVRLVKTYRLLPATRLAQALGLDAKALSKEEVKQVLDDRNHWDGEALELLRALYSDVLAALSAQIDQGNEEWLLGFISGKGEPEEGKLINLPRQAFFQTITAGAHLGPVTLAFQATSGPSTSPQMACRLCMQGMPVVRLQQVTFGEDALGFHNQKRNVAEKGAAVCAKCALSAYLQQRVLGSKPKKSSKLGEHPPQIPHRSMMIFHRGRHASQDAGKLAEKIDAVVDLLSSLKNQKNVKINAFSAEAIRKEVAKRVGEGVPEDLLDMDEALLPGLATWSFVPAERRAEVIVLGAPSFPLLVLIIPQFEAEKKDSQDLTQRHFSESRLMVFTFLALFQRLCGCDGPYYFQSAPRLRADHLDPSVFYVGGKAQQSTLVLTHYSAVANFARRLAKPRPDHSLLADWILLAERIEAQPYPMLSDILRRTPLSESDFRNKDKFDYLHLAESYTIGPTRIIDGTVFLQFAEQWSIAFSSSHTGGWQREEPMTPFPLRGAQLDELSDVLFRALDQLQGNLLPLYLNESAHAFEKYPRLLVVLLQRHKNVELAFAEWADNVLRNAYTFRLKEEFPALLKLEGWMVAHRELFEQNEVLTYLNQCLLFLAYRYLWPRRELALRYLEANAGNQNAWEEKAIQETFAQVVQEKTAQLTEVYGEGDHLRTILADAEAFLVANAPRLAAIGKKQAQPRQQAASTQTTSAP